jgi:hypothetical protein
MSIVLGEVTLGKCSIRKFRRTDTLVVIKEFKIASKDAVVREARFMQLFVTPGIPVFIWRAN